MKMMRSVYSYYYPEVRKIIDEITRDYPHDVFLTSTEPNRPLDNFEKPIIQKYIKWISKQMPGLEDYQYVYFTNGSGEAIFHILCDIKTHAPNVPIYSIQGDYEGYKERAGQLNLIHREIETEEKYINILNIIKPGYFFITNPSSIHGNIMPSGLIDIISGYGHKVIYDATYVSMTKPHNYEDISHPHVDAVLTSFSKPFGLFYYRIGFLFSRAPIPSLETNKWFKNILSLIIAEKILDTYSDDYFYNKYSPIQRKIIKQLREEYNFPFKPSDVFLLAHLRRPEGGIKELEEYARGSRYYRFCLTPYFLDEEKRRKKSV